MSNIDIAPTPTAPKAKLPPRASTIVAQWQFEANGISHQLAALGEDQNHLSGELAAKRRNAEYAARQQPPTPHLNDVRGQEIYDLAVEQHRERVAAAQAEADDAAQRYDAIERQKAEALAKRKRLKNLVQRVEQFLTEHHDGSRHAPLIDAPLPPVPDEVTLDTIRTEIADIISERTRIATAAPTRKEVEAIVDARIAAEQQRAPRLAINGENVTIPEGFGGTVAPLTLWAWLDAAGLKKHLLSGVEFGKLTASERYLRYDELNAAMLEAERIEEAIIRIDGGERRPGADIRAVLSIRADVPEPDDA